MSVVIFDPEKFRLVHPAFTDEVKYPDEALENAFNLAVELIGNDDDSPIPYEPEATPPVLTRAVVLDLVTCHIATQNLLWDDTQTGPVTNATEGSVSAGFGSLGDASAPAYWMSTKCGAQAWQILQRYVSGPIYFGIEHFHMGG